MRGRARAVFAEPPALSRTKTRLAAPRRASLYRLRLVFQEKCCRTRELRLPAVADGGVTQRHVVDSRSLYATLKTHNTCFFCLISAPMRLALHTDYALRTLLYLAMRPGRGKIREVAAFYQISKDHVAKAVTRLGQLGFVRNIRGIGGGIELAKQPEEILVGDVILALEGNMNLLECVSTDRVCVIQPSCKLRHVFAEAERRQSEYLRSVRLSDLLESEPGVVQITIPS